MCMIICYHTYVPHDERTKQGKHVIQLDQHNLMVYQPKRNNLNLTEKLMYKFKYFWHLDE